MAERPILFSGPMVRAILDGRKTQTRRVLKPQPPEWATLLGDRLWVREAWRSVIGYDDRAPRDIPEGTPVRFEADDAMPSGWTWGRYRPGMFMPRWASRLTLEVTRVRIERLQDISEEDAIAEGAVAPAFYDGAQGKASASPPWHVARPAFADLWNSINGPGSWDENPWVAAYTLKRVPQKGADGTERHSFVRAEAGMGSDADEVAYREALARGDKEEMARLDAESQQRMADFDARFPEQDNG